MARDQKVFFAKNAYVSTKSLEFYMHKPATYGK